MKLPAFYPILDSGALARGGVDLRQAAAALLEAGVEILQLRHKQNYDRETYAAAKAIAEMCRTAGALFVVNDRADVARMLDAALHLGQEDLMPGDARFVLGEERKLGFSTHNRSQLEASNAEPIDYVALGPIFGTVSKEDPDPVVGIERLRDLRALTTRPLVAIGGITRATGLSVLRAGADSLAVIGDLYPEECSPRSLRARAEEWIELTNGYRN